MKIKRTKKVKWSKIMSIYWMTRDKEIIPIRTMETSHIRNSINLIKLLHRSSGQSKWRASALCELEKELRKRNET